MKHLIVFALFFSLWATVRSQPNLYQVRQAMEFYSLNKLRSGTTNNTLSEKDIEGSPYLNDEFVKGSVFTTQKQQFVDIPLRYNIFNDELEFKTPDNVVQALATPELVEKATFGEHQLVHSPYFVSKNIKTGFFEVLVQGKASLYAKHEVVFNNATEPAAYKEAQPAKFVAKPEDYYIRAGNDAAFLISGKKDLMDAFPDHKNKMGKFVKENKVKPNKPETLKQLVEYYNSL